jgi:hypothetical protein
VKPSKRQPTLPIGRAARIAFEIDGAREGCCQNAEFLCKQKRLNETELEECARLDDALAQAQRVIKATVRNIMLSRLRHRSRKSRAR